jgi:hypothetical protein
MAMQYDGYLQVSVPYRMSLQKQQQKRQFWTGAVVDLSLYSFELSSGPLNNSKALLLSRRFTSN